MLSFYAASSGAADVICLEPEAAGSTSGSHLSFEETKKQLINVRAELAIAEKLIIEAETNQHGDEEKEPGDGLPFYDEEEEKQKSKEEEQKASCQCFRHFNSISDTYRLFVIASHTKICSR